MVLEFLTYIVGDRSFAFFVLIELFLTGLVVTPVLFFVILKKFIKIDSIRQDDLVTLNANKEIDGDDTRHLSAFDCYSMFDFPHWNRKK